MLGFPYRMKLRSKFPATCTRSPATYTLGPLHINALNYYRQITTSFRTRPLNPSGIVLVGYLSLLGDILSPRTYEYIKFSRLDDTDP